MAQLAVKLREPAWVDRDSNTGGWRHQYWRAGTVISPQPRKASWRLSEAATLDIFCHDYTPNRGDVVIDLGAGWGTEVLTFSKLVGPEGRVIACEAHPWTADLLTETVRANGLTNVEVAHVAIADKIGVVSISDLDPGQNIQNSIINGKGAKVSAITLDELCRLHEIKSIDLLKANIEGAEGPMLAGMVETMSMVKHAAISCHDFVAVNGGDDSLRTKSQVVEAFTQAGHRVTSRSDDRRYFVRDYVYTTAPTGPVQLDNDL